MKQTHRLLQAFNIRFRSALHSALTLMLLLLLSGHAAWAADTIWVEDAVPSGATTNGDSEAWNWISTSPTPYAGTLAHQSNLVSGEHQHYFYGAAPFNVGTSDTLFAYVYLDPTNPPTEIMLQWHDAANGWEHRAYWGGNTIPFGTDGTTSRKYIGALPATGGWVRLNVPASAVGLAGISIDGMAFALWNGKATWDQAGKSSTPPALAITTTTLTNGTTGTAYSQTLTATGGATPYTWSYTGSLPAGLNLNTITGLISGTPTTVGTSNFTVKVQDNAGANTTQAFSITIAAAAGGSDTVWVEDAVPSGATTNGDSEAWNWVSTSPAPYSGTLAHQSNLVSGEHQHYFYGAAPFNVGTSDTLFAYVYLDPTNPPTEIMLQWHDAANAWEHRAYWGANNLLWGTDGSSSRKYIGPLPATGTWVRLNVPASAVGLGGISIDGMAFALWNGKATWDKAGKSSTPPALAISTTTLANGTTGTAYSQTLTATGGTPPYTWSITSGSPPTGLTLNTTSGLISGTPTTAGTSSFTAKVQDNVGANTTQALSITIAASGGTPSNVALQANGGIASASSSNYSGLYPTTAANNGDRLGSNWTSGNKGWADDSYGVFPDWLQINFAGSKTINEVDVFSLQDNYTTPITPTPTMTFSLYGLTAFDVQYWNGTTWITVPGGSITGNNLVWRKVSFPSITTDRIRLMINAASDGWSRVVEIEAYTATTASPTITTTTLPAGTTGASYSQTLTATGGTPPYTWSITSGTLPAGLSLTTAGIISGTPTTAGTSSFTAKVQDNVGGNNTQALSIVINAAAGSSIYYIFADHLNTPRVITDTSNNVVWKWDSDPFGTDAPNQNPSGLGTFVYNLRFPGQYYDQETHLNYNYFRDYDPSTGRYVQSDPIGLRGGINLYAYVGGNPVTKADPLGLATVTVGVGGSFQQTAAGASQSYSVGVSTSGKVCVIATTCARIGPGVSAGAGVVASAGKGDFCPGNTATLGVFGEGGDGFLGGGSVDVGSSGDVSGSVSFKGFVGGGAAAGTQLCATHTSCW